MGVEQHWWETDTAYRDRQIRETVRVAEEEKERIRREGEASSAPDREQSMGKRIGGAIAIAIILFIVVGFIIMGVFRMLGLPDILTDIVVLAVSIGGGILHYKNHE